MKTLILVILIGGLFLVLGCRTACPTKEPSSDLVILKAVYGVGTIRSVDVTDEIRSLAKNGSIRLHPQWGLGVDPAYGATKRVTIAYKYQGQIEVATFDQFEEFVLPVGQ
ncbi:MAG TPA: DUF3395 domain-containing protein [bacterium]|nr:DUF3395 domain-containing protein [bacterium]